MKKIIVVLFIMIPFFAFGQEKESIKIATKVESSQDLSSDSLPNEFWITCPCENKYKPPIILLNNIPLKDYKSLYKIDTTDIKAYSVIKKREDLVHYGKMGENGVIKIEVEDIDKYKELLKEEYETIVFAPGFESFVAMQPSKSFFSESWLKSRNSFLVTEWNNRYRNPSKYNSQIYEAAIDYDSKKDYGLDVEYTLYMFFRFMEKENNMSLIGDRQITQR